MSLVIAIIVGRQRLNRCKELSSATLDLRRVHNTTKAQCFVSFLDLSSYSERAAFQRKPMTKRNARIVLIHRRAASV